MKKHLTYLAALLLTFLFCADVRGAGFALYEYSARTTAMGGATVANGAEPASLGSNPALITRLPGTQVQLGLTAVTADATTSVAGYSRKLKNDAWLLPDFFVTHQWSEDITLGLGGFSRYGLGGEYQNPVNTWPGSNLAYKVKLETFSFTPTIAIKANDELSVSMGLEAMIIGFKQDSMITAIQNPYSISGSGVSWGGNFAFIYTPRWAEKWALGAMYRTKVKQNLNGRVKTAQNVAAMNIYTADGEGSISLPDSITAGLSFRPTDKWTLEAGVVATMWSSYDQILIQYKDIPLLSPFIYNQKQYKDTIRANFGLEYLLNEHWALRAGYVYDKSPINKHEMDTLVPVDDRHIASIGAGYKTDRWSIDAAYAHIFGRDMSGYSDQLSKTVGSAVPVKYTGGHGNMYSLTVGYKF